MSGPVPVPCLVSYEAAGRTGFARLEGQELRDLAGVFRGRFATLGDAANAGCLDELFAAEAPVSARLGEVALRPPLANPGKIICVGVNFPDRDQEYDDGAAAKAKPSLFVRFPQSFVGHGDDLRRPPESEQLDYEGEIAIVIARGGRRIAEDAAWGHIAAATLCNEGTIRDWLRHARFNVTQGKNWDRSASMGPGLVAVDGEATLLDIRLETRVNGELRQSDRTSRMTFGFARLVSYISTFTTLVPGDVIVCGTPTGAGARLDPPQWLRPGDVVEVRADGLGALSNGVRDEESK